MPRRYRATKKRFRRTRSRRFVRRRSYRRGRRAASLITPDKRNIKLKYIDTTVIKLSAAATSIIQPYALNGLYDVYLGIGNTAIPGFAEWGAFYKKYRVNMAVVKVSFTNMENEPVRVGFWAQSAAVTTIATWTGLQESSAQKYAKTYLLSPTGGSGDSARMKMVINLAKLLGNRGEYKSDDNYQGTFTSNPGSVMPGYLWAASYNGTNTISTGVAVKVEITYYATIFGREYLQS